jgi:TRAP-type mannitol/chloroaromatic compound transport system substrate-binding protein
MTERRRFLARAGGAVAVTAAATLVDAPNVIAQAKVKWRMPTTWPPALDVLQGSAQRLAQVVGEMTGGRFTIEVFSAGQIMPPLGVFDAASQGTIESFMASTVHWPTKDPALVWFTTVPFGMNPQGMQAWFYQGDGLKLWEEAYAAYSLVPRPGAAVAPQMAGWFRKKINSTADFKGLKMRIPGLGGKVVAKAGGTVVLTPGGEIYTALERGVIDASEWVGPHDDMKLGLHQTARYYYYPGWHELGTTGEFVFNRKAYDALPAEIQHILDYAAASMHTFEFMEYESKNGLALQKLRTEFKAKVEIVPFPAEVLRELRKLALEVNKEESEKSPMAKKVYESYGKFQTYILDWNRISEGPYYSLATSA